MSSKVRTFQKRHGTLNDKAGSTLGACAGKQVGINSQEIGPSARSLIRHHVRLLGMLEPGCGRVQSLWPTTGATALVKILTGNVV